MEVVEFGKIPGDSIVVVCQGVSVSVVEHIGVCVGHGDSSSCPGEHGEVVGHVTEGDDLRCGDVVVGGPLCECGGFGDSWGGHFGEASRAGEGEEGAVVEDVVHLCEEGCVIEMWCLGEEFSYWDIDHCFDECPACVGSVWVLGYEVGVEDDSSVSFCAKRDSGDRFAEICDDALHLAVGETAYPGGGVGGEVPHERPVETDRPAVGRGDLF